MEASVPESRIQVKQDRRPRADGAYVLYWMTSARRPNWNFAPDRAVDWAVRLDKPIVIVEALNASYPWANERIHRFIVEGMLANAAAFDSTQAAYFPYIEGAAGQGAGLIESLAKDACLVVTDDFPCFFLPAIVQAAAERVSVRFEAVDGNGILPMREADRTFLTAHSFRRHMQRRVLEHLNVKPRRLAMELVDGQQRERGHRSRFLLGAFAPRRIGARASRTALHTQMAFCGHPEQLARGATPNGRVCDPSTRVAVLKACSSGMPL